MAFQLDRSGMVTRVKLSTGEALYSPLDMAVVGGHAVPRRILFHSGGGDLPWFTMGVELVDDELACTYLEFDGADSTPVCDKHLKITHIERMVREIAAAVAQPVEPLSDGGMRTTINTKPSATMRAMEGLQRRRRNVSDPALVARVAEIYAANPNAPIKAIVEATGMSESTAKRWARRASDAGLLPAVDQRGKKRI